jgi:Holliday junction resolvasome RuvABC endonuclease subunit
MSTRNRPRIMGIDAGFANLGAVIVELTQPLPTVVYAVHVSTQKAAKKRGIRVADDDAERIGHILRRLDEVLVNWSPRGLVAELPPGGAKGANAMKGLAIGKTVVCALSHYRRLPAEWVTPMDVKRAAADEAGASKERVQAGVQRLLNWTPATRPAWSNEHVADAAAAVLAARHGTLLRALEEHP